MKTKFVFFKRIGGDSVLWTISIIFLLISLPFVYSASAMLAEKASGGDMHFFRQQIISVFGAFVIILIVSRINFTYYMPLAKIFFGIALFLAVMTLFVGISHNDARRWLRIPLIGIELQTSELVKLSLILFMTKYLTVKKDDPDYKRNVRIATAGGLLAVGVIYPADISSALLIISIVFVILFIAGVSIKDIYVLLLAAALIYVLYGLLADLFGLPGRLSTAVSRIQTFLAPSGSLPSGQTLQTDVAGVAIKNGGFFGCGPADGVTRYVLPQAHTDFIFASIIEEYGLVMAIVLCLLYSALVFRGILIAKYSNSMFGTYLANGISLAIVIQTVAHMAVSVNLLPTTGQPLPFISLGRTSLWITAISVGILLNISKAIPQNEK